MVLGKAGRSSKTPQLPSGLGRISFLFSGEGGPQHPNGPDAEWLTGWPPSSGSYLIPRS